MCREIIRPDDFGNMLLERDWKEKNWEAYLYSEA